MHRTILLIGLAFVAGCSHANKALNEVQLPLEARQINRTRAAIGMRAVAVQVEAPRTDITSRPGRRSPLPATRPGADDGCFIGIAISGGGSRSANFAASTMFQLQRLGVLQRTDAISGVSGGALAAAYYCVHGKEWNPATVQKKFTHSYASDLIVSHFMPWNLLATTFSDYDRSDLLAENFSKHLYSRDGRALTFADLRPDRPTLLINATDIQSGRRFVFCNESFDDLNSDLSKFPIAYAVAASSAVPVAMHHVTLRDYSTSFKQYRHLMDGGTTDNLGVQALLESYDALASAPRPQGQADPYPNGAVIIVIDATANIDHKLSDQSDVGLLHGLKAAAGVTGTLLLNRASNATLAELIVKYSPDETPVQKLRDQMATLDRDGYVELRDRSGRPVRVLHIALTRTASLTDVPFPTFRESVTTIATYFNIKEDEAFRLDQAASLLMRQKFGPRLHKVMRDIDGGNDAEK